MFLLTRLSILCLIESMVVWLVQLSNPALCVVALYCENADELLHSDMRQIIEVNWVPLTMLGQGIHMSLAEILKLLALSDLYVYSEQALPVGLFPNRRRCCCSWPSLAVVPIAYLM